MQISVIIPTYNRADWLAEAVSSVLCQTLLPAEVLIVDDGSTDRTRSVVEELARESPLPLKYIHQDNRGAASPSRSL